VVGFDIGCQETIMRIQDNSVLDFLKAH